MSPTGALRAVVASIPSPPDSSISIGPLDLRAYGLLIALGVIAAVWMAGRMLEQKRIGTVDDASSVAVWGVVAGIIGARLYHVVTDWDRFSDDLGSIPKIWEGGLGIPGGLLFGVAAGAWQANRRGIPPAMMMTAAAPAIPLAQAIGRWGNWFNQELYGRATDLPWGLEIDDDHLPAGYESGTTFHPTFLYESLWNLGLVGVLLWVDRRLRLGPGRLMAVYLIGYGAGRFWIEGLRIDPASELAGLRWNQWVALAAIAGGVIWLVLTRGQKWPDDAPEQVAARRGELATADVTTTDADREAAEAADDTTTDADREAAEAADDTTTDADRDTAEPSRSIDDRPTG